MQPEKQRYNCGSLVAREMQLSVLGFGCGAVGDLWYAAILYRDQQN